MFRRVIKYVAFLGVLIGIGIITKVIQQVIESASIKGKPQQIIQPFHKWMSVINSNRPV